MRKIIALGIMLLFLGMTISSSTSFNLENQSVKPLSFGNILYVGGNGTGNYTSIQDAIDDASDGDTVFVYDDSSPYYENVVVDKSINLIGEDKNTTIIDGTDDEDYTVLTTAPYVTLTGFTIQYCTDAGGIGILVNAPYGDSHGNAIYGNIIRNTNYIGIGLYASSNNNIYRNNITNHDWGIYAQGFHGYSSNNTIYQNNIMKNGKGIYFSVGFDGDVSDNRVYQNNLFRNFINAMDEGSENQWDNGSVGNFWDDYRGKDENGDGIGDKPYWISRFYDIKDNYPLMKPFDNITSCNKNIKSINQRFSNCWFNSLLDRFPMLQRLLEEFIR